MITVGSSKVTRAEIARSAPKGSRTHLGSIVLDNLLDELVLVVRQDEEGSQAGEILHSLNCILRPGSMLPAEYVRYAG